MPILVCPPGSAVAVSMTLFFLSLLLAANMALCWFCERGAPSLVS